MSAFGLALLPLLAVLLITTGLPAYAVLIFGAVLGATAGVATGVIPLVALNALPSRLIGLLESDLLQALPLFVLMGALLGRLNTAELLFRLIAAPLGDRPSAPKLATLGLGALLGPMNGSVGASVLSLSRAAAPSLKRSGLPAAEGQAIVAVAGTLGVVIPPSLVLILLGDALLSAHTLAVTATGRADRVINTQDVFRSALIPALMFLAAAVVVALLSRRAATEGSSVTAAPLGAPPLRMSEILGGSLVLAGVVALLGAVALGLIYAVEAAATGAVALFAIGLATGRLGGTSLRPLLADVLVTTGVLFAPLLAATSFTLVLRLLGTDKLVERFIVGLPGGPVFAVIVVLLMIAASAVVLDAFEIVFVMVPVLAPPLLMRVPDAAWVAVLLLLTLQASFLLPPIGYALSMARSAARDPAPLGRVVRALWPYLAAQLLVLGAVLAAPALVHMLDVKPAPRPLPLPAAETRQQSQDRMINALPPRAFGTPTMPTSPPK